MTWVNEIVQVSDGQFYNASPVLYCVFPTPGQSPSITMYPPLPFQSSPLPAYPLGSLGGLTFEMMFEMRLQSTGRI